MSMSRRAVSTGPATTCGCTVPTRSSRWRSPCRRETLCIRASGTTTSRRCSHPERASTEVSVSRKPVRRHANGRSQRARPGAGVKSCPSPRPPSPASSSSRWSSRSGTSSGSSASTSAVVATGASERSASALRRPAWWPARLTDTRHHPTGRQSRGCSMCSACTRPGGRASVLVLTRPLAMRTPSGVATTANRRLRPMRRASTVAEPIMIGRNEAVAATPAPAATRIGSTTAASRTSTTTVSESSTEPIARPRVTVSTGVPVSVSTAASAVGCSPSRSRRPEASSRTARRSSSAAPLERYSSRTFAFCPATSSSMRAAPRTRASSGREIVTPCIRSSFAVRVRRSSRPYRTVTADPSIRNSLARQDSQNRPTPRSSTPSTMSVAGTTRLWRPISSTGSPPTSGKPEQPADQSLAEVPGEVQEHGDQSDAAAQQRGRGMEAMPRPVDVAAPQRHGRRRHGPTVPRAASPPAPRARHGARPPRAPAGRAG